MAPNDDNKPTSVTATATVIPASKADALQTSVEAFNAPLAHYLTGLGLPTDNILATMDDRRIVIQNLEHCLQLLPLSSREKAYYLTKFSVAIAVGLFDSAINYLWNESIAALRSKVAELDLQYFFDIAEKREKHRAKLQTADDLAQIEDAILLDTSARIGLLTDVNRERLRHINYMRNHASAAHPNATELSGTEMLAWLTNCLKYAILAEPDPSVVHVDRLLHNIRETTLSRTDIPVITSEALRLPQDRIDDLMWTLFGLYTDTRTAQSCRDNIGMLAPAVWSATTEPRRYAVGARHAFFLKNADTQRKDLSSDFLQKVDGLRYRSEDVLVADILDKLRDLEHVHHALNNFYNEWPHALALQNALPPSGIVPTAARHEWVKVICQCFIGNGNGRTGIDENAEQYYVSYIRAFGEPEVHELLGLFGDPSFTVDFGKPKAEDRARMLATELRKTTKNVHLLRALDIIVAAPARSLRGIAQSTPFKNAMASATP